MTGKGYFTLRRGFTVPEMTALARSIGHKIRQSRLARNMTQADLADGHFSKSYISQLERGTVNPSLRALRLLADRLDVSVAWLLESGSSPPTLLIKTAQTSFYLGNIPFTKKIIERLSSYSESNSLTFRDQVELLLLKARLSTYDETWEKTIEICSHLEKQLARNNSLPRHYSVSHRYLWGNALFHEGNRRQAIHHWEIGLQELNKWKGPPTHESLYLLKKLAKIYESLGDQSASNNIRSRLLATATQIQSTEDLSLWVLGRRQEAASSAAQEAAQLMHHSDDLADAEAWARAHVIVLTAADIRDEVRG